MNGLLGRRASLGELVPWVGKGLVATFEGLGHFASVGLVLAAVLVVGLVVAWTQAPDDARRRGAAAVALAVGGVIFIASAALIRKESFGDYADPQ